MRTFCFSYSFKSLLIRQHKKCNIQAWSRVGRWPLEEDLVSSLLEATESNLLIKYLSLSSSQNCAAFPTSPSPSVPMAHNAHTSWSTWTTPPTTLPLAP